MGPEIVSTPQYYSMLDNYYSIVEKTNQQLSLWYNPYGLSVAILTALFAIGAIVVSIMLVNNSREQKRQQQEFFDEQKRLIGEQNEIARKQLKEAREEFDILIQEHQEKLKLVDKTDKENKRKIEKELENLKKQKATLGLNLTTTPEYSFTNLFSQGKTMVCSSCGKSFSYSVENSDLLRLSVADFTSSSRRTHVYCSHCGAINIPL